MSVIIPGRSRGVHILAPQRMGFGHLSSPALFFSGIVGDLLTGISHSEQRCTSYLDDIIVCTVRSTSQDDVAISEQVASSARFSSRAASAHRGQASQDDVATDISSVEEQPG
jgi:hypothetical protein